MASGGPPGAAARRRSKGVERSRFVSTAPRQFVTRACPAPALVIAQGHSFLRAALRSVVTTSFGVWRPPTEALYLGLDTLEWQTCWCGAFPTVQRRRDKQRITVTRPLLTGLPRPFPQASPAHSPLALLCHCSQ
ncbi:hypothetical protein SKAU_G00396500 [Synaphobranchus kaupii]|uniref:Uncharacterized protein n=1 Tax=Synaphobranchus kaupii TaxID=118154 RepID=A0A9Q1ECK7_SYNKA|nr:hypothetical protein SKAU_G00396500 [Synaphobranchus kaupii]